MVSMYSNNMSSESRAGDPIAIRHFPASHNPHKPSNWSVHLAVCKSDSLSIVGIE